MKSYYPSKLVILAAAAAGYFSATQADAQAVATTNPITFSANATVASEQAFRGRSQTNREPAFYGSVDLGHSSGAYAGLWSCNRSYGGGIEQDAYVGWAKTINDVGCNVGYVHFFYPNNKGAIASPDFSEVYANVSFQGFKLSGAYSPGFFNTKNHTYYKEIAYSHALGSGFSISGLVGHSTGFPAGWFGDTKKATEYLNYDVTVSKAVGKVTFSLSLVGTDLEGSKNYSARAVFGVKTSF
jgi:uncharacterized protein (TIGR02001 family)